MRKEFKKAVAVVSAFALAFAGIAYSPSTATAATSVQGDLDVGNWHLYAANGSWGGGGVMNYDGAGTSIDDMELEIVSASGNPGEWTLQAHYKGVFASLEAGKKYDMSVDVKSSNAGKIFFKTQDSTTWTEDISAGSYTVTKTFTRATSGTVDNLVMELSGLPNGTVVSFDNFSVSEHDSSQDPETPEYTNIVETLKWQGWFEAEGWASYSISDTHTGYTLENKGIGANWYSIQTALDNVPFKGNKNYVCRFDLTTSSPKKFKVDNRTNDAVIFTERAGGEWKDNGDGTYTYTYIGDYASAIESDLNVRVSLGHFGDDSDSFPANGTITATLSNFVIMTAENYAINYPDEPVETTTPNTQVETTTPEPQQVETTTSARTWTAVDNSNNKLFYNSDKSEGISVVNVQKPGFAAEDGIYMTLPSGISSVSINGNTTGYAIQGAGVVIYVSALTEEINEISIEYAEGTGSILIKNLEPSSGEQPTEAPTEAGERTWVVVDNSNNKLFYNSDKSSAVSVVNVQKPGFADEDGIYMTLPSGISSVTVNGNTTGYAIQGAGVVVYISSFTQELNTVVIEYADGTAEIIIKNTEATAEITTSPDVKVDGLQMNVDTTGVSKNSPSFRVILKSPTTIDENSVESYGTLYALASEYAGDDNGFVKGNTDVKDHTVTATAMWEKSGDANQYFTLTFTNNGITAAAMSAEYMIRPYAVLSNETVVYGEITTVSPFAIAKTLYDEKMMSNQADHEFLYNNVLNVVTVANDKLAIATAAKDVSDAATGNAVYKALGVYNRTYPRTSGPDLESFGADVVSAAEAYYYPVVAY
ncbi:MAG: hypothetical protein K6G88_08760 [Lachnospiraceae bacterium]|nr:hypothetical protein [Lachnospiraceae bacterium]